MAVRKIAHPSIDDRKAKGLEARDRAAPSSHTKWRPAADRPDPVALLEAQDTTREPDLVPVRHGRIGIDARYLAGELLDDCGRHAGGAGESDPGRAFGEVGKAGGIIDAWQVRQLR